MLKIIKPKSSLLQKHIECFYIFNKQNVEDYKYVAFPHFNTGLSFIKNADVRRKDFEIEFAEVHNENIEIEVLGRYTSPLLVTYKGLFEEYSIIFKPLGISRFIKEDYHSIASNYSQAYENSEWGNAAKSLFQTNDINTLEDFLIEQYHSVKNIEKIEIALELINNTEQQYSIPEIANSIDLNLKSFQRYFLRHIGCSALDYKRIVRFRNSISSKIHANEIRSLTEISYENNYFDQSYFIKEFKKLTNHNPKNFFKEVSQVDGDKIIWEIL